MLDQEENGITNISDNLEYSWDCCNDYQDPTRPPRIYPRKPTMNTGENINLYLKLVHPYCYVACFTWRILSGGGYLDPEFGIETYYHAPSENEGCGQNPTIEARCPREQLDVIRIGINQYAQPGWAFVTAGAWQGGVAAVGTRCFGRDAYYPWEPFWTSRFACIHVARRNCDRSVRNWDALQIGAMMRRDDKGEWVAETDRFYSQTGILTEKASGNIVRGSFAECKQGVLNARVHMWLGAWIEAQDPRPSWEAAVKLCRSGALLRPGGALDVRHKKLLDQGCCPYDVMPELDQPAGREP